MKKLLASLTALSILFSMTSHSILQAKETKSKKTNSKKIKKYYFYRDIWPIVSRKCVKCHKPHHHKGKVKAPHGKLDLRKHLAYKNLVGKQSRQAKRFKIVEPGKPELSYLIYKLQGNHKDKRVGGKGKKMPPKKSKIKLYRSEIKKFILWIKQGAKK